MLKAIIFDFDGTLLETELPDYTSWQEVYRQYQCELPLSLWLQYVGMRSADFNPYEHLESLAGVVLDRPAVRRVRRQRLRAMIQRQGLLPGVAAALTFAQDQGIRMAVASSSSRDWVEGYLVEFELLSYFETVCTADDVTRTKPDPEIYRLALTRLGVNADEVMAVEDSRNGLLAAKAAGLRCLVVPNQITSHSSFDEADLRVASLDEVDWPRLRATFETPTDQTA